MTTGRRNLQPRAIVLLALGALGAGAEPVGFSREVLPILSEFCFECHGPDAAQRKADLRLDTEEGAKSGAVVPGRPGESELVARIGHEDPGRRMPPESSRKRLSQDQIGTLVRWVEEGARWEGHWSFVPVERPPLPEVEDRDWVRNGVDAFVLRRLEEKGLAPAPEAGRSTLARRASLDLTGLPPEPHEALRFLEDGAPGAWERLLDRLIASPRHGEHMAWSWMEAARYADTDGYQNDGPRDMWRWRDWVIEAFNRNMPFDRFTVEQLAGDLLPQPTLQQRIATGFNRNNRYNSESGLVFEEFLLENAVDRVDTTSTVWMGLTMGCARCHDHKYDPLSQKEYYGLVAYFDNVAESGRAIKYGNSEPWIRAPTPLQEERLGELEARLEEARLALERNGREIRRSQERWEETAAPAGAGPLVADGLNHHFPGPILCDGERETVLEDIPGLICNGRFTISFRMTPEDTARGAVLSSEQKGWERQGILVEFHQGRLRFHIVTRWIAGLATLETEAILEPGRPVHVALTNDGTQRARGMGIYLDGVLAPTRILHNSNSNKSADTHGDVMRVGGSRHHPGWRGEIRDLRFYNRRTLYPDEIEALAEPASLADILELAPQERSPGQRAKLRRWYLEGEAPGRVSRLFREWQEARKALRSYSDSLPTTMVMEERPDALPTHLRIRGAYDRKGEAVEPGVPSILPPLPGDGTGSRLGLARWLVSGEHPLTARVTVNRLWQQFFGRGLVETPEDFGIRGRLPSHPLLLDWLSAELVDSGWDLRHVIRLMMESAAYRQSSRRDGRSIEADPENRLLSGASRLRLRGAALRDQALLRGGLLVERQGGPSVKPYQPPGLWREASNFRYAMGQGEDLYRRSLYTYWKRTLAPPSMTLLDASDREWCSVRIRSTNTPLQALALLNERAFVESAVGLGRRILEHGGARAERLRHAFLIVASRHPEPSELEVLDQALESYLQEYRESPEAARLLVGADSGDSAVPWAAHAALANMLLNLEEVATRE